MLEEAVNNTIEDDTNPSAEAMYTETIRAQTNPGPGMTTNNMSSYSQVTSLRNPTIPVTNKIHKLNRPTAEKKAFY